MALGSVKDCIQSSWTAAVEAFFDYDTPKIVHIRSKKVGFINRTLQILVVAYLALYVIWWEKGYQEKDVAICASTTKLKGVALSNFTALNFTIPGGFNGTKVWDVADYVVPPQENNAFFVMTNVVITPGQTQNVCAEDPWIAPCTSDSDCTAGKPTPGGNGVMTGHCVNATSSCQIHAWCPVEDDQLPFSDRAILEDSKHFTLLIKNFIEFPRFQRKRRNILDSQNSSYLKTCRYNSSSPVDRLCPIFTIADIVAEAHSNSPLNLTYTDIAVRGGVIAISIDWDCNLDYSLDDCLPVYTFSRLDDPNDKIAKGSNFRYASTYEGEDGVMYRDLFKSFGIRFIIKASGTAGKFSIVPLLLNIGSGIGLLAIATVICDIIILYVLKKRHVYKAKKYLQVHAEDLLSKDTNDDDDEDNCSLTRRRTQTTRQSTDYDDVGLLDS